MNIPANRLDRGFYQYQDEFELSLSSVLDLLTVRVYCHRFNHAGIECIEFLDLLCHPLCLLVDMVKRVELTFRNYYQYRLQDIRSHVHSHS